MMLVSYHDIVKVFPVTQIELYGIQHYFLMDLFNLPTNFGAFLSYLTPCFWFGDATVAYQLGFQDSATTTVEGIYFFKLDFLFLITSIIIVLNWLYFSFFVKYTESDNSDVATFVHSNPGKTLRIAVLKLSEHIKDLMYYVNTRILILMSSQFVLSNFRMFMLIICILFNNADIVLCAPDLSGLVSLIEAHEEDLDSLKEEIKTIKRSIQLIVEQNNLLRTNPSDGMSNIQIKRLLNQLMDEQKTAVNLKISNLTKEINSIETKAVKAQTDAANSLRMSYLSIGFGIVAIIFLAIKK